MRSNDTVWHRLLLLLPGLALCAVAQAVAQPVAPPRIELTATPAWQGWSRPGRSTEIDIRLSTDTAVRATLKVLAGRQTVRSDLELQPGRVARLHIPVGSAGTGAVTVMLTVALTVAPNDVPIDAPDAGSPSGPPGPPERRELVIAQSESPLLGVGLAADGSGGPVGLEGFHSVALTAQDLPRNASAYSIIDALILDAPTLSALDQRQLAALLAHAAACGRIVLLNVDPGVRQALEGAGGCGGQTLMMAASLSEARQMLRSSLAAGPSTATTAISAISATSLAELSRPSQTTWNRLAVALAVYFAAALLALLFFVSWPVSVLVPVLVPVLATVALLVLLHTLQPPSQLRVWSEAESGAQVARYQAWQQFPGQVRERLRVPIPPQLAAAAQPCDPAQSMRFDFDAARGQVAFAEFETRLFRQVRLCYSGNFPMARAMTTELRANGLREVRNTGPTAWPAGWLLAQGKVDALPAVAANADTVIGAAAGPPLGQAVARTAMARIRPAPDGVAALWPLELAGVAGESINSIGWLLVSVVPR